MSNREVPPLQTVQVSEVEFRKKNRRSFLTWIGLGATAAFGIQSVFKAEEDRGVPWPLRRLNELGESIWKSQFHDGTVEVRSERVTGPPRRNGNIGITEELNADTWRLIVSSPTLEEDLSISLADLRKLPQITETFEFKCIEGWSEWMTFKGVRFADFMANYGMTADSPQYAGMTSVDGAYYVAMDLKSLLHSQTMLCLEMNGEVLTPIHGFPVRLITAVKYGVKNIKQIGRISFTETQPADYWAENGYGEYLGL